MVALFSKYIYIYKTTLFQKIEMQILNVDNVEIYKSTKYQFKIWCILGYQKDKYNKISSFENMYCSSSPDV
jgi:hypothetical protein